MSDELVGKIVMGFMQLVGIAVLIVIPAVVGMVIWVKKIKGWMK